MFRKTLIATGVALATTSLATYADYQTEVIGTYSTGEVEAGSVDSDIDTLTLRGGYYFEAVDTSKGPLAEASFLDRASGIHVDFTDGEIDGDAGDADIEGYGIDLRYVVDSGWLLELGYRNGEIEDVDLDTWAFGVGKYIADNTTLTFNYANIDIDSVGDADAYGFDVRHFCDLGNSSGVSLEAGYSRADVDDGDDANLFSLGATYYPNNNLGLGVAYSLADADGLDVDNWSLFAEWFVNEQVALSLVYNELEADDLDAEADAVTFGARIRF